MAGLKLDGAGLAKMATLDAATMQIQRVHATIEQWADAVKNDKPTTLYSMQAKRSLPMLASLLKAQFGMIADTVTSMNLTASRGGSDAPKIRGLREGVAHVRQALEISIARTKALHAHKD
jgi:hypothetical protein